MKAMQKALVALLCVTALGAFGDDPLTDPSEAISAYVHSQMRNPSPALRAEMDNALAFCSLSCESPRLEMTLIDGFEGKQGYSVKNYLVTLTYLSRTSGMGEYRVLPLIVTRTTKFGRPKLDLAAVLGFGSLEMRLRP